jgi:UDP-3-O-[3-hydroxymyristoyl] N-acetylglucosamine deacetylase
MNRGVWIFHAEHLLSALYGFGIDNAFVELDNFEVPILDGSGLKYIEAIQRVGIVALEVERSVMRITKSLHSRRTGRPSPSIRRRVSASSMKSDFRIL